MLLFEDTPVGSLEPAADDSTDEDLLVSAAVKLAALRRRTLRHVLVAAPDVGEVSGGQPQSPTTSATTASGAVVPAAAAAAPAAAAGTNSKSKGGSKGGGSGGPAGAREPRWQAAFQVRAVACARLQAGAQQPRLLTGTLSQVLQFLACLVGNSAGQA